MGSVTVDDWAVEAACRRPGAPSMYPAAGDTVSLRAAVSTCVSCPVRVVCLRWALEHDEAHGVWGGFSAKQRSRLMRHMRNGTVDLDEVVDGVRPRERS